MNNQPDPVIAMTDEQKQQLEVFQRRLTNLQNEGFIASKLLSEAQNDCDRITRERDYQQEILTNTVVRLTEAETQYAKLVQEIGESSETLRKNTEQAREISIKIEKREQELKSQEESLSILLSNHEKKVQEYTKDLNKLMQEKLAVTKARSILQEAINNIKL